VHPIPGQLEAPNGQVLQSVGRYDKLHYLDPVPIQEFYLRWTDKYAND
jgi:hypothetical protein